MIKIIRKGIIVGVWVFLIEVDSSFVIFLVGFYSILFFQTYGHDSNDILYIWSWFYVVCQSWMCTAKTA